MSSQADNHPRGEGGDPSRYASEYHAPVLCDNVVQGLVTDSNGVYVDATLGGGGHSAALLDRLGPRARVYGIDQDRDAIEEARRRLGKEVDAGRFVPIRGNFADMNALLESYSVRRVDGLLMDLGVSSHQIDAAERGFSFQHAGSLDMRMDDRLGFSAHDLVNTWDFDALRHALRAYGEEPQAARIARRIIAARPLETTAELAREVRAVVPDRQASKTLARVFQALRIAVNEELHVLEKALLASVDLVRPGGRVAIISYHSLEDRRVKRFLRYGNFEGRPMRDVYGHLIAPWRPLSQKAIRPDGREISLNPRARSARLRIAERLRDDTSEHIA